MKTRQLSALLKIRNDFLGMMLEDDEEEEKKLLY